MAVLAIGGAVIGAATSIFGASSQARAERRAIQSQYEADREQYDYNWTNTQREYDYRIGEIQIAKVNETNNIFYQEQTAQNNYKYDLAIRDFDYNSQQRQFAEAERIYGLQVGFNAQGAAQAFAAENRKYEEILTGMAFDQQDMFVKMLQEEGMAQASGVSGRSAGKVLASALASYGRNQAVAAESLVSATRATNNSRKQIGLDLYGANLNAQSRRMLRPQKAPDPVAPTSLPRTVFQDPLAPVKPPEPRKGTPSSGGALGIITSGLNGAMSGAQMGYSLKGIGKK
jgi:hypothetical protein